MTLKSLLGLCIVAVCQGPVCAEEVPLLLRDPVQAVADGVMEAQRLVRGPALPEIPGGLESWSCEELYVQRVALLRKTADYVPVYDADPRNATAIAVGASVFTPAYYYLGYTALQDYRRGLKAVALDAELTALRQASAAADCFVR